jgi:O-antigen/teichoic acid export membrane protein
LINAVWRYLPESTKKEKVKILSSAFWGINGIGIIVFLVLVLFREQIASHLQFGVNGPTFILILLCNSFLFVGGQFILWMFQYEQKAIKYLAISLFQFLGVLILNIIFVLFLDKGIIGVLYSKFIVFFILYLISGSFILWRAAVLPSITLLKKLMKYGLPLVIVSFVTPILTLSDRYFLNLFVSLEEIGVYSIAYKFGMLINMLLVVPLQRTLTPLIYQTGIGQDAQKIYKDAMFYYALIGCFFLIVMDVLAPSFLQYFATKDYLSGAAIIPWITLAYFINGFRSFFRSSLALKDKTTVLGWIGIITIILNIGLNFLLIRELGVTGAVIATVISYLFVVSCIYFNAQRIMRIDWKWIRLIKLATITLITIFCYHGLFRLGIHSNIFAVLLSLVLFCVSLLITKTIGWREINGIKLIFHKIKMLSEK